MLLHRRNFLATVTTAAFARAGAAQETPPRPAPRLIERSRWSALWTARLDAHAAGFVVAEATVLRRWDDGLILLVREQPAGSTGDDAAAQHVRLERRDSQGRVVWRQPVPGLPARFGGFASRYLAGSRGQRSLLVTTFLPADNRRTSAYGRIVEVDETAGRLRPLGGIGRPRTREWIEREAFELHGALPVGGDRLVLYGGFGTGPYRWWVACTQLDGTTLWEAMGHSSAGEVTSMRVAPGGFEASVFVIMAWPDTANVGLFRMRFDRAGRLAGSLKVAAGRGLLFAPDGTAIMLGEDDRRSLTIEDRQGRRRTVAVLESAGGIRHRLDDGAIVLYDDGDHDLIVASDGHSAVRIERDMRYDTILGDGSIFSAACVDETDCRARQLALHRRPW